MTARSSWFQSLERGGEAERHSERPPRGALRARSVVKRQLVWTPARGVGTPLAMTPSSLVVGGTADAESAGPLLLSLGSTVPASSRAKEASSAGTRPQAPQLGVHRRHRSPPRHRSTPAKEQGRF